MDTTAQWRQEVPGFLTANNNTMGEILAASNNNNNNISNNNACTILKPEGVEKKARPQEQLNCPRCKSTNTKFCYYNNYSLTQPRYFCKTCRRYWTEGGTLRNVPVGGGSRKNKKSISIITSSSSASNSLCSSILSKNNINDNIVVIPDLNPPTTTNLSHFSSISHQVQGQDLNLAFPANIQLANKFQYLPTKSENDNNQNPRFVHASSSPMSFLTTTGGQLGPDHSSTVSFSSGFQFQEFKPSTVLGFSDHGLGSNKYNFRVQESSINADKGGRMLFPFGELKHNDVDEHHQQHKAGQGNNPTGYWSGLLGGGSW